MDDSYQQFIKQFLASNKAEALEWLRAGSDQSFRNLGEMEANESVQFVAGGGGGGGGGGAR